MRSMTEEGEAPLEPWECIDSLRAAGGTGTSGIGIEPIIVSAIVALVSVLVKALVQVVQIKNKMPTQSGDEITWSTLAGYGTESFSAGKNDFPPYDPALDPGNDILSDTGSLVPWLLGGGALLYFSKQ